MGNRKPSIAVVGAGIGGLAVAATLRRIGIDVQVYEQAPRFERIGAGIQMMPNSMKVLRGIGVEERLRRTVVSAVFAFESRSGTRARSCANCPCPRVLFGAPYLCMHRADLHAALASALPQEIIHLDKKLVGLDQTADECTLAFADGTRANADAVIGADGVHSLVREIIVGPDAPIHKGRIAYRAVFSAALLKGCDIGPSRTKWWGTDRHIVIYYTTRRRAAKSISSPACPSPRSGLRRNRGRRRATCKELRKLRTRAFMPTCAPCSKPVPIATSGRFSNASRCRAGAMAASCCSATPAIP